MVGHGDARSGHRRGPGLGQPGRVTRPSRASRGHGRYPAAGRTDGAWATTVTEEPPAATEAATPSPTHWRRVAQQRDRDAHTPAPQQDCRVTDSEQVTELSQVQRQALISSYIRSWVGP